MSEQLKYIIQELNKPPFSKAYNLISFDTLQPLQLLQVLTDVLAEVDIKHKLDVREEAADQTAIRMFNILRVLKYKPPEDAENLNNFRQGLVQGDKLVIYPILEWLMLRIPELQKRAYLAKYLVKLEIAPEFTADEDVDDLYKQYAQLIAEFKEVHKESEQLKQSGFNTADIKKDITSMEDEKDQLIKRVERLKRKLETQPSSAQMLVAARDLRLQKEEDEKISKQKQEQHNLIVQAEQRIQRLQQQIKDTRQASIGATPEGLLDKLEEENKVNSYMLKDRLPKEITTCKKNVSDLQRVVAEPAMGQSDLDVISRKIQATNSEVNQLVEKRMMNSDPMDDKLSLFRQQAAIIVRKKEVAAESLRAVREALEKCEREAEERREVVKQSDGEDVLKGDEFKRYVNKLRTKSTQYKKLRQAMAEMRAEAGVLSRTEEILRQRQDGTNRQLSMLEAKQGVSGYRQTQEALENVSTMKSEVDQLKGRTMEDISYLVQQLNSKIQAKRGALAPIVSELRTTRTKAQELTKEYDDKKTAYDSMSAGMESNRSKLEQEVRTYREEISAEESRFHYLNYIINIIQVQQRKIAKEMKLYVAADLQERKKSFRELYTRKIQEQENLGKSLRDRQKMVRETQEPNMHQVKMWKDFARLMQCKTGGNVGGSGSKLTLGKSSVQSSQEDMVKGEDRLII